MECPSCGLLGSDHGTAASPCSCAIQRNFYLVQKVLHTQKRENNLGIFLKLEPHPFFKCRISSTRSLIIHQAGLSQLYQCTAWYSKVHAVKWVKLVNTSASSLPSLYLILSPVHYFSCHFISFFIVLDGIVNPYIVVPQSFINCIVSKPFAYLHIL